VGGGNRSRQRADVLGSYALLKPRGARADERIEPPLFDYEMNLFVDYTSKLC
jgi:hypothetical protein